MKLLLLSVLLAITVIGLMLLTGRPRPTADRGDLPDGWLLDDLDRATPPNDVPGTVFVLAWKIVEDDRPLRVEHCLVLKHFDQPGRAATWTLASLFRRPQLRNNWEVSKSEAPELDHSFYRSRPTNADVDAFRQNYGWSLGADDGFKLIDGRVCRQAWLDGIGEEPNIRFPR